MLHSTTLSRALAHEIDEALGGYYLDADDVAQFIVTNYSIVKRP